MLLSTFRWTAGIGEARERALWRAGVSSWSDYDAARTRLPKAVAAELAAALDVARAAHAARDVTALATLLPSGEHWRLFAEYGADAAYLDIETGDDTVGFAGISAIGVVDRWGPHLLLPPYDFDQLLALGQHWSMLVTFNGLAYDVPILRAAFPDWQPPAAHVDLRHVLRRIGHAGTLKQLEERLPALHLGRPPHLRALRGSDAARLFQSGRAGDRAALQRFAEYNLYDAVNLRTLMAHAYNALADQLTKRFPCVHERVARVGVPERGDLLYDISKLLLRLE